MMNADGSPGVSVDAAVGAKTPLVRDLAWWLTIPGIGLGLLAVILTVIGVRGLTRTDAQPSPLGRGARERVVVPRGAGRAPVP